MEKQHPFFCNSNQKHISHVYDYVASPLLLKTLCFRAEGNTFGSFASKNVFPFMPDVGFQKLNNVFNVWRVSQISSQTVFPVETCGCHMCRIELGFFLLKRARLSLKKKLSAWPHILLQNLYLQYIQKCICPHLLLFEFVCFQSY